MLANCGGALAFVELGGTASAALCCTLRKDVLQVVVRVLVATGNVDELGVLVVAAGELFVFELRRKGKYYNDFDQRVAIRNLSPSV